MSEELGRRFDLSHWQYTLSASTANVEAIRLARVATARERVLYFDGKYHGHFDESLVSLVDGELKPEMIGLPADIVHRARMVDFNDLVATEAVLKEDKIACVVLEPALTNIGVVGPQPDFLPGLRALTREHGTVLIFDETHTQVCAPGGLARTLGVTPDIVVLGKCLGGGIPIGAYGMTEALARVMEHNLDVDGAALESVGGIATGGTLFGNALSLAAARTTLKSVLTPEAFARAAALGARLSDGIEAAARRHGLNWRAHRLYCRSGVTFGPHLPQNAREARELSDFQLHECLRTYMANREVWEALVTAGPAVSFAMDESDVDHYLAVFEQFLTDLTRS